MIFKCTKAQHRRAKRKKRILQSSLPSWLQAMAYLPNHSIAIGFPTVVIIGVGLTSEV